jgi:hypothetical protein
MLLNLHEEVPRTIDYERIQWNSVAPLVTNSLTGTLYVSANRSVANSMTFVERALHFWTTRRESRTVIDSRRANTTYLVDHAKSAATVPAWSGTCTWESFAWPEDPKCSEVAGIYDPDVVYKGSGRIAGVTVAWYGHANLSHIVKVAFGTSARCELMEEERRDFLSGQLMSYSRYRVTKYVSGEPDSTAFRPPPRYRLELAKN